MAIQALNPVRGGAAVPRLRTARRIVAFALLAVGAGWLIAGGYAFMVAGVGMLGAIVLSPDSRRIGLAIVTFVIAGYVIADRVFAYLGASVKGIPIYPGEAAIAVGVLALAFGSREPYPRWRIGRGWTLALVGWSLFVLVLRWGAGSPLDTVRDFALIYYLAFAVFGYVIPWERLTSRAFNLIAAVFILQMVWAAAGVLNLIPSSALGSLGDLLARADVEGANLMGGAAFFLLADGRLRMPAWMRMLIVAGEVVLSLATGSRAVLLAVLFVLVTGMVSRRAKPVRRLVPIFLVAVSLAYATGAGLAFTNRNRGLIGPVTSIQRALALFNGGSSTNYLQTQAEGTYQYRIVWWRTLLEHDKARPGWLVMGRGFGPNLAVEVGYASPDDTSRPLRAPHSIAVDIFARLGIIGIILWIGAISSVGMAGIRTIRDRGPNSSTSHWMFTYWGCLLLTAMVGVVLESPFGAAPFFFLTGGMLRLSALPDGRQSPEPGPAASGLGAQGGAELRQHARS